MKKDKTGIKEFIKNVMERKYSVASKNLSNVLDKKMQQKIINNNIKIF
jgi:hypothetical protein